MGTSLQAPSSPELGDPQQAIREVLRRLGPRATDFPDAAIAEAARRLATQQAPAPAPVPAPSLGERVTGAAEAVGHAVASGVGDMANWLRHMMDSGIQTAAMQDLRPELSQQVAQRSNDLLQSYPAEKRASVERGMALSMTMLASPALGKVVPIIPGVTNRATQLLTTEALAGATYGALHQEPGETVGQAAASDAALFGLTGGAIGAAGTAVGTSAAMLRDLLAKTEHVAPTNAAEAIADAGSAARNITQGAEQIAPMAGTAGKGFEVTGTRATPPVPTQPTLLEMQQGSTAAKLAQAQTAVNAAVAVTPLVKQASPELQQEASRLIIERAEPLSFDGVITKHFADGDDAVAQALVDHGHANYSPSLAPPGTPGVTPQPRLADILQRFSDEQLGALGSTLKKLGEQSAAGFAARRLLSGTVGAAALGTGTVQEMQGNTGAGPMLLRFVGTGLLLEAGLPMLKEVGFVRATLNSLDARRALTLPGTREAADQFATLVSGGAAQASVIERRMGALFPDAASQNAIRYAREKGAASPYWGQLSSNQQQAVQHMGHALDEMGNLLEQHGVIEKALDDYMPRILKPTALAAINKQFGGIGGALRGLQTSGSFAKHRVFAYTEELENWLTSKGISDALEPNGVKAFSDYLRSSWRALANRSLIDNFTEMGYLRTPEKLVGNLPMRQFVDAPEGWRYLEGFQVWNELNGKMAPTEVANLLETVAGRSPKTTAIGNAYDALNGLAVRTIMYNRFIHGFNLWRGRLSAGVGEGGYGRAMTALRDGDDVILDAANHGVPIGQKMPEISSTGRAFDELLKRVGQPGLMQSALEKMSPLFRYSTKLDEMIEATGVAVYQREIAKFGERTKFQFGPGSAEYEKAANAAGAYAADQMGRAPMLFRSPGTQKLLRRALFAPQWFETRWNLRLKALGEAGDIIDGGIPKGDALYAPAKLRMLALWAAGTTALSYGLSGQPPEFNANTGRFYAHTGLKDRRGREIGIDPAGWFDDDLRALAHPVGYAVAKAAPAVGLLTDLSTGRDYLGRQLSGMERLESVGSHFGGLPQLAEAGLRVAASGNLPTAGEAIKTAAGSTGFVGSSTLPRAADLLLGASARKALIRAGVEPSNDRIFELSKIMRADWKRFGGYGNDARTYIARAQDEEKRTFPGTSLYLKLRDILLGWAE